MAGRLTDKMVKRAAPKAKQYEEYDRQDGLSLVVFPSGAKSWVVRYRADGKLRKATLGALQALSLKDARREARALLARVDAGEVPTTRRRAAEVPETGASAPVALEPASCTVREASVAFMKHRSTQERKRAAGEVQRQFNAYILPSIGERPLSAVTGREVRKIVTDLMEAGKRTMANRVHATCSTFFKWAAAADQDLLPASPYARYDKPAGERKRTRTLTNAELAKLWHVAGETGHPYGSLIRWLILTGQRRGEVAQMTQSQISDCGKIWTVPETVAKNGIKHPVPLSPQAVAELATVTRIKGDKGLLFTNDGETAFNSWSKAKAAIDRKLGFNAAWCLHDVRRTFVTRLSEMRISSPVVEALVNHANSAKQAAAGNYNLHTYEDEAELAMEAWGRFVADVVAHDARRARWEAMRARERVQAHAALQADDDTWTAYIAALDAADDADDAGPLEVAA